MWLSDDDIEALRAADDVEGAYHRALDYLSYRPRSESEMRYYLSDKDYPDHVVEEVLARLRRVDLVDDVAFAQYWCDNRARLRPRGKRMLRHELRQKGVNSRAIDEALETYDELVAVDKVARDQARRLTHLPPDKFRRRLTGRLARRGFSYDLIRETLATLDFPDLNHE
jgi:regulatory protein